MATKSLRTGSGGFRSSEFAAKRLVPDRHAGDLVALEVAAGGFGAVLVEAGKARAIKLLIALSDPLGERLSPRHKLPGECLRLTQALLRLRLLRERADLDDPRPARMRQARRHRPGGDRHGSPRREFVAWLRGSGLRDYRRLRRHSALCKMRRRHTRLRSGS